MADRNQPTDDERERLRDEIVRGLTMEKIQVEPWYLDVRGEIVQPDQVTVQTKYFWSHWAGKLGPLATCLLLRLRQYCYFNRATGEKRDWCYPSQETLGDELGAHRETIGIALKKLEALGFVRREAQYRYDANARRSVRTTDKYYILMEDPIVPEDEPKAFVLAAQRMLAEQPKVRSSQRDARKSEIPTYGPSAVDNSPRKSEIPTHEAVGDSGRKSDLQEAHKNVNVASHSEGDELRIADLTAQLVEELRDPGSRNFYRLVVQRMPEAMVYMTLSETKDAKRTGQIRKSAGAYFTHAIKAAAERIGVDLSTRTPSRAQNAALTGRKTGR